MPKVTQALRSGCRHPVCTGAGTARCCVEPPEGERQRSSREECDAHLADAARVKAHRLLELASKLSAGTASASERDGVQWDVRGVYLEPAESVPVVHLARELTDLARRQVHIRIGDGQVIAIEQIEDPEERAVRLAEALQDRARAVQRDLPPARWTG